MLDFEELYEDVIGPINRVLYKFRDRLKADRQDLEQELFIKIFNELDKIEDVRKQSEDWQGYVYVMCLNHLRTLELEEHKQGLWMTGTYEDYMTGTSSVLEVEDPFLEWYYEHKREYNKKWREEHPDYYKQYIEKNREHINKTKNQWKKDHKEYVSLYNKLHREKNLDYTLH